MRQRLITFYKIIVRFIANVIQTIVFFLVSRKIKKVFFLSMTITFVDNDSHLIPTHNMFLGMFLLLIGFMGMVLRSFNMIYYLLSIELIFLGAGLNFLIFGFLKDDIRGAIFFLLSLSLIAAESAVALAIVVVCYSQFGHIYFDDFRCLYG